MMMDSPYEEDRGSKVSGFFCPLEMRKMMVFIGDVGRILVVALEVHIACSDRHLHKQS